MQPTAQAVGQIVGMNEGFSLDAAKSAVYLIDYCPTRGIHTSTLWPRLASMTCGVITSNNSSTSSILLLVVIIVLIPGTYPNPGIPVILSCSLWLREPATTAVDPSTNVTLPLYSRFAITGTPFRLCPAKVRKSISNVRPTSESVYTTGFTLKVIPRSS